MTTPIKLAAIALALTLGSGSAMAVTKDEALQRFPEKSLEEPVQSKTLNKHLEVLEEMIRLLDEIRETNRELMEIEIIPE